MKPTEEQIKKFWEWCGFSKGVGGWTYCLDDGCAYPDYPPIDLNNLFKYAVPKAFRMGYDEIECRLDSRRDGDGYMWLLINPVSDATFRSDYLTNPALALFWAINKVIEG